MRYLALLFLFCGSLHAACSGSDPNWTSTADNSSLQTCINSAGSGSTITVSGSATWSTSPGITVTGKALTLRGGTICSGGPPVTSCTDNTVITYTGSGNVFQLNVCGSHLVRIEGFTFSTSLSNLEMWSVDGENSSCWFQNGFVIGKNHFIVGGTIPHIGNPTGTFGLIYNNEFDVTGGAQAISPIGTPDGSNGGFTAWQQTGLNMGGDNAVFIEGNFFNYSVAAASSDDSIDAYGGTRVVIRHNQFTNTHVGFHGYDSGNRRSPMWIELYQNTFTNNTPSTKYRLCTYRGGTGVVWGNATGGTNSNWDGCTLMVYRASPATGGAGGWGNCNGTQYVLTSNNFSSNGSRNVINSTGSFDSTHVGACSTKQEFLCTGNADCTAISGGTCQAWSDGSGNAGYPCRDQPGTGQNQVRDPIYFWSNTGPGASIGSYDGGGAANDGGITNYLSPGRDYINNGTTPKPGYTPFTYPHPLQGNPTTPPPAPSGVSFTMLNGSVGISGGIGK